MQEQKIRQKVVRRKDGVLTYYRRGKMYQKSKKSNRDEVKEWDIEIGLLRPEEISSKKNSDIEADLQDDNNEHG